MAIRLMISLFLVTTAFASGTPEGIQSILTGHCLSCHSSAKHKGDLDLEASDIQKEPQVWEAVLEQIANGEMPPEDEKQLTPDAGKRLTDWVRTTLDQIALANAGDPGPVVLRRLSNMEYTYTIRDLTGVASLDPAAEFPVDGAAGEGFTNVGAALVMSPALLSKYLDAAKEISNHAVFTRSGMHWSASTSSRDWTNETMAAIREFYAKYSGTGEATATERQGIKLATGAGSGLLPLANYLDALQGRGGVDQLSEKYLKLLEEALAGTEPSLLLDPLRQKFREQTLSASDIESWQQLLWHFAPVGHIGKKGGPKVWQEAVNPLVSRHEIRIKLSGERDVTLYLAARDAGNGTEGDEVIWENPRIVAPGRPDLPVGDLPALVKHLQEERARIIASAEECLNAIAEGSTVADSELLSVWRAYLGLRTTKLESLLSKKNPGSPEYPSIQGWEEENALSVLANSSDDTLQIPGTMKGHSIATHPSPELASVIAWQSPVSGTVRIDGEIADAHTACGNGILWTLELRRENSSQVLASGETGSATPTVVGPLESVPVEPGQVLAFVINPREGNHICDLTAVNLTIADRNITWDLAKDVSPNILKGNPHGTWHFLSQPASSGAGPGLPAPIIEWRTAPSPEQAARVRAHLQKDFPLSSPLLAHAVRSFHPKAESGSLRAKAPSTIEVKIPAALAKDGELIVTGRLATNTAGSVQMQVLTESPPPTQTLMAVPIIVNANSEVSRRFETGFDEFRSLFPIALCYPRMVPVDEVVTLKLFHREDEHLKRLMLDEAESATLNRLWEELMFVSEAPLKQVDAFEQLYQYATQDSDPGALTPLRDPILKAAGAFRAQQKAAVSDQREAVIDFAAQAWRRPLTEKEIAGLKLFPPRLMLVRVLASPAFLYRGEIAPAETGPVSGPELASRLSYFLWSSAPDEELRGLAENLHDPAILSAQARRMLKSDKIRRLATEFGCQWLHVRDLATLNEKSERHFPTFLGLRDDMQEEVTRFFIDLFRNDRSILTLLDADHSFVNAALAKHYGIEAAMTGEDWQRVDGFQAKGRGGILGFAATLSKQSGASRNSAILRGTWLSEVILGEKLPNPPLGVPDLPDDMPGDLTERQLIERHSQDKNCSGCHRRIDPFGFALEGFDAIGRLREADTKTTLPDGTKVDGLADLRAYLRNNRSADFQRQFCRKLLGYALGRSVQFSDKPLIEAMINVDDRKIGSIVEMIVLSPQFREARGRDFTTQP